MSFGEYNIDKILIQYEKMIEGADVNKTKNSIVQGLLFGYSSAVQLLYQGFAFWWTAKCIELFDVDSESAYTSTNAIMMGAAGSAMAFSSMPSVGQAIESAQTIFKIIDRESKIDVRDDKAIGKVK